MAENETVLPPSVAIYDRDGTAHIDGLGARERAAACYRWATARGLIVIDQAAGYGENTDAPVLESTITLCQTNGAGLLVYSLSCLTDGPDRVMVVRERLSPLPVLCAYSREHQGALR